MHVYTDGEDWWVAASLEDAIKDIMDFSGDFAENVREMADDEPLTLNWEEETDEENARFNCNTWNKVARIA